jgi:uncharacterized iron-regulated protein
MSPAARAGACTGPLDALQRFLESLFVGAILALAGCSALGLRPTTTLRLERPVVLLGEVHDNAGQHALRLQALQAWLARGGRPVLVMEQFDRERQGAIDELRSHKPAPQADALIAAAGTGGWDWAYYRPYIALALEHDLPIVAANVSREQARRIMTDGLAAHGFDAAVPAELVQRLSEEIEASHCGALDAATARRMVLAQVARDQSMARAVDAQSAAGHQVLLLAGNGHVRIDGGAPRWLSPATRARSEAIGVLETGSAGTAQDGAEAAQFDRVVYTAVQQRSDPCLDMPRPTKKPG